MNSDRRPLIFGMVSTRDSKQYTAHALDSFFKETELSPDDEFILIDNDQVGVDAGEHAGSCVVHRPGAPQSFAENVNDIIRHALATERDLVFLNNDVIFSAGWLSPLLEYQDRILVSMCNREVQYRLTVQVLGKNEPLYLYDLNSHPVYLSDYQGSEPAFAAIAHAHSSSVSGYWRVITAPFFCFRIPLTILRHLGLFDTSFGLGGGEDYDYSLRAYLAGFEVNYALSSFLLHFGGKSTWNAKEAGKSQQKRQEQYQNVFRDKWGEKLTNFLLFENQAEIEPFNLSVNEPKERLAQVLRTMLGDTPEPILAISP